MSELKEKRISSGFYKRYDGVLTYVIMITTDIDTGVSFVVCKEESGIKKGSYFVISKASFCETVEWEGEAVDKYKRQPQFSYWNDEISELAAQKLPTPQRRNPEKNDLPREFRQSDNYYDYAKNLCENYKDHLHIYNLCKEYNEGKPPEKFKYVGVTKNEYKIMVSDLAFVNKCRKTVLSSYEDVFVACFKNGLSIRKYASEKGINRGSVAYMQNKLYKELAKALEERDKADGVIRIKKKEI